MIHQHGSSQHLTFIVGIKFKNWDTNSLLKNRRIMMYLTEEDSLWQIGHHQLSKRIKIQDYGKEDSRC